MPGCEKALRHLSLFGERPLAPREEFPAAETELSIADDPSLRENL